MEENPNIIVTFLAEGISRIKLNEPGNYNALSSRTIKSLIGIFKSLNDDNKTKVIIIEGSGKGFSGGHDLKEIRSLKKKSKYKKLFNLCSKLMLEIVESKKPVIAKVHGAAFAAGCQLVASCDLAVAVEDARFAVSGINVGLFCSTPAVPLSRSLLRKQAMKMLFTGEFISASKAQEYGLINEVVPVEELESATNELASKIVAKSAYAIRLGKEMFYKQLPMDLAVSNHTVIDADSRHLECVSVCY